ncbi:molybdenum cofactor guanylyltransferase [Alteromonas lipolytica]|uniref:MobA-like NTP transferase domain-containing protein n=1 Tax=Alteromonas lipolytica TaxID=1856405 RepID=A0A1E8FLQ6_9ALTE|nr:molybdenum cofactor guanylyltransferase [Alteromonas lipolytica]OFI36363.1 hypothetical protein BFC17_00340 [Alteromonas lipolytica]GGF70513.1 molybdenum cofactor guanylyltransferase [Alteromonas lipolytica]
MKAELSIDRIVEQAPHYAIGFILAGGRSSRMGTDKARVKVGEKSMLSIAQSVLGSAALNQHFVVGGDAADLTESYPGQGPASAIAHILQQFTASAAVKGVALFLPVDMPNLSVSALNHLLKLSHELLRPVYYNDCYLPLVLPVSADVIAITKALVADDPCLSVRKLLQGTQAISEPFTGNPQEMVNINRPEDLTRLTTKIV